MKVVAHLLAASGAVPNHPRWPLLVHPFHHYHGNAHEALGVYSGEVTVVSGGENGIEITARPGDVIVLPAGTGHKRIAARGIPGADPVLGPRGPLLEYWKA